MPHIVVKNQNKVEIIEQVARFFEAHDPGYYQFCLKEIPRLRQVSRSGYTDPQGRYTRVSMKVPTKMFLALQRVMNARGYPRFGEDSDDIALMTKVWKNLDASVPMEKDRVSLFIPQKVYTRIYGDAADDQEDHEQAEGQEEESQARQARRIWPPPETQVLELRSDHADQTSGERSAGERGDDHEELRGQP